MMMEACMAEKQGNGFTFKDKEDFVQNDSMNKAGNEETAGGGKKSSSHDRKSANELPEINFASFIISLSSSALFLLGDIPDPATNQTQRNLPLAKQTIDILGLLKEKTVGNLERDETQLLESLLYDLRMRYVAELKKEAQ
jgi:hypothetical protein